MASGARTITAGTTSLFAALNVATGAVVGDCYRRHRAVEFRKFLNVIAKAVPKGSTFIWYWTITTPTRRR